MCVVVLVVVGDTQAKVYQLEDLLKTLQSDDASLDETIKGLKATLAECT